MFINHQPFLIIISSPSGAGKSTLCKMIVNNDPLIRLSISATTRKKRPQEIPGQHYFFVSREKFIQMQEKQEFLESAEVFENLYGTPKKMVDDSLKNGHCVLFDIDWQGARQIKEKYSSEQIVSIFILPPSIQELERRLRARAQDPEEIVMERMRKARNEISHFSEYDYLIINDDLNNSYLKIRSIIETKRVERQNSLDISNFINQFL
ncbi:MAG: guanylate kinase [Alphaproteobacteria bacterium]|nr:guanylate kinase [Alphaproteobacteria bacterium]